jgi:hypothetical protein
MFTNVTIPEGAPQALTVPASLVPFFSVIKENAKYYIRCKDCDKMYESNSCSNLRKHRAKEHGENCLLQTKANKRIIPVEETVMLMSRVGIGDYKQGDSDLKTLLENSCDTKNIEYYCSYHPQPS